MTEKREPLYEGKAKILYATDDPSRVIQYFKDDATAFNAQKRGTIVNKGVMNNRISSELFTYLGQNGIPSHYIETLNDRNMLVKRLKIIPIEFVFRNVVAGSLAKRLGIEEGKALKDPVFELYYKDDALGDPFINDDHALAFAWATAEELKTIKALGARANELLRAYFSAKEILLVDGKLEFGRDADGKIVLGDEITPDGMRLWDMHTHEKLDKDRFRRDLGGIEEAYQRIYRLVCEE